MTEVTSVRVPYGCHLPRDERGWRMPRWGTKSARIYTLLEEGKTTSQIHAEVGGSVTSVRVLTWKIRNPVNANKLATRYRQANKE